MNLLNKWADANGGRTAFATIAALAWLTAGIGVVAVSYPIEATDAPAADRWIGVVICGVLVASGVTMGCLALGALIRGPRTGGDEKADRNTRPYSYTRRLLDTTFLAFIGGVMLVGAALIAQLDVPDRASRDQIAFVVLSAVSGVCCVTGAVLSAWLVGSRWDSVMEEARRMQDEDEKE